MIKDKEVKLHITARNITKYRKLGYDCSINSDIYVKIEHLAPTSEVRITALCDSCGVEIPNVSFQKYNRAYKRSGSYCCKKCGIQKRAERNMKKYGAVTNLAIPESVENIRKHCMEKYGVSWITQIPEVRQKIKDSNVKHWGTISPLSSPVIRERIKTTNIKKYGVDNPAKSDQVKAKIRQTNLERYGTENAASSLGVRQKMLNAMYEHGTKICSKQQLYLCNIFDGLLNYPVHGYSLDIAFPEENIYIEYDGGGHDLGVKFGELSQNDFDQKEIVRNNILKREHWKRINIISAKDKIPSDEILLQMVTQSKQYFADFPDHSWMEWNIDKGIYRNAEYKDGVLFNYGELRSLRNVEIA